MEVKNTKRVKEEKDVNSLINGGLIEENRVLHEAVESLREELDRFKSTPLMVAEVKEVVSSSEIIAAICLKSAERRDGEIIFIILVYFNFTYQ